MEAHSRYNNTTVMAAAESRYNNTTTTYLATTHTTTTYLATTHTTTTYLATTPPPPIQPQHHHHLSIHNTTTTYLATTTTNRYQKQEHKSTTTRHFIKVLTMIFDTSVVQGFFPSFAPPVLCNLSYTSAAKGSEPSSIAYNSQMKEVIIHEKLTIRSVYSWVETEPWQCPG